MGEVDIWAPDNRHLFGEDAIEPLLEPRHGVLLGNTMREAHPRLLHLSPCNACSGPSHYNVEVHSKDTNTRIVPRPEIDMFLDSETKMPIGGEVATEKLVFLDLKSTFKDFFGFGTANGDVHGDLFVASDAKGADSVSGFGRHGRLAGELLEHFRGSCKSIA